VKRNNVLKLAVVGVAATVLPLAAASQAFGDYAPQSGDVVGVGGDTPQYAVDFLVNGDTVGDLGFDSSTGVNRVIPFDATADGNGRQAYAQGSTESAAIPLNPTDVLRAGDNPVQRVQSSGAALNALVADTGNQETINYIFSASLPSTTQQSDVTGGLDVVKFGTDTIQIAVNQGSTNAPAGLSANELLAIYQGTITKWNQLPGNSAGSGDTIIPEIPPSSSSIYSKFIAALTTANGGTAPSIDTAVVKTVEQNDPTAITAASTPADAIAPFSSARLNLWNDDYFHNPATVYPGASSPLTPGVTLLSGTPGDSNPVLDIGITDYIIFRASDASLATPYQPGGSFNWVQTLFYNPNGPPPYIDSTEGQALIQASGVTPSYSFLGQAHS
jgi:ABC-type phosphate transport system substrate-binding protein